MLKQNKKAFTLVELIVVIAILAILGTIAFISLQGYSKSAKDSRRISDMSNIKKSLEMYSLNVGKYPIPDEGKEISYNSELLRTQGLVGNNVASNLSKNLSKKPVDPLYNNEYIYSITNSAREYELLSFYEGDLGNILLINTFAFNILKPKVSGNYNGVFVKTPNIIIPTPSIINSEIDQGNIVLGIDNIKSQIISDGKNFPKINIPGSENITGQLDVNFSPIGAIDSDSSDAEKILVINAIQEAYSGSELENNSMYFNILSKNSDEEKLLLSDVLFEGANSSTNIGNNSQAYSTLLLHGNNDFTDAFSLDLGVTNNGVSFSTDSKFGSHCFYFNGTSDFFRISANEAWTFGTGAYTVDFWVKTNKTTLSSLISNVNTTESSDARGYWRAIMGQHVSNKFEWTRGSTTFARSISDINDNLWHHLAISRRDDGTLFLYVDGELENTITDEIDLNIVSDLQVGVQSRGAYLFSGYMDEIRISKGIAHIDNNNDYMYDPELDGFSLPTQEYGN